MPSRLIDYFAASSALSDVFSDTAVISAMLRFETALARAQARLGMIPESAAAAIGRAGRLEVPSLAEQARESASLAIPFVRALTERVGGIDPEAAGFVHWGATSQDLLDTALVLLLRRAREILAPDHNRLQRKLRYLSSQHGNTVMLARTLLQPAAPTTFGYKAAGWFGAIQRSWRGWSQAFDDALQLQFGGAAGTLASYGARGPELAAALAAELDLPEPPAPWHSHRDGLAALVAHAGIYTGCLAKAARDIALLTQPEIAEVSERGGGSSAMPHKRNPAGAVVVLAAAAPIPGMVAAFLSAMPQEHERAAGGWQAEWPMVAGVVQASGSALAALAETVDCLAVDAGRMRANIEATHGAVFAEKAAMLLAPRMGRAAAQAAVAAALEKQPLREGLAELLSAEQLRSIDLPEDYLGAAETLRRRLLEEPE
jgi:3-carboxy-cis,cis-muconate cycloisomerase